MVHAQKDIVLFFGIYFIIVQHKVAEVMGQEDKVQCGDPKAYFEKCFEKLPESSQSVLEKNHFQIPYTDEEIKDYCIVMERGFNCYDAYKICITDPSYNENIEGHVLPAKLFNRLLCKDQLFQSDYRKHRDCFKHIQQDINKCAVEFRSSAYIEFTSQHRQAASNVEEQRLHLCCARFGYEKCIHNSATRICRKDSAEFARKIAQLLSNERHFQKCHKYEDLCSYSIKLSTSTLSILLTVVGMQFISNLS